MRLASRLFVIGMLGAATGLAACASQDNRHFDGPLGGSTFAVTLRPEGQEPMPDRLVFSSGTFESTMCTRAGFNVPDYQGTTESGGWGFYAKCDSPSMGHNDWHGVVVGDHIEGT